jgi:hypothetical protein
MRRVLNLVAVDREHRAAAQGGESGQMIPSSEFPLSEPVHGRTDFGEHRQASRRMQAVEKGAACDAAPMQLAESL